MEKVYILYEGNAWLSNNSLVPMGVFENEELLTKGTKELIFNTFDEDEAEEVFDEFKNFKQTSGRDYNYFVKEVELNKIAEF